MVVEGSLWRDVHSILKDASKLGKIVITQDKDNLLYSFYKSVRLGKVENLEKDSCMQITEIQMAS